MNVNRFLILPHEDRDPSKPLAQHSHGRYNYHPSSLQKAGFWQSRKPIPTTKEICGGLGEWKLSHCKENSRAAWLENSDLYEFVFSTLDSTASKHFERISLKIHCPPLISFEGKSKEQLTFQTILRLG